MGTPRKLVASWIYLRLASCASMYQRDLKRLEPIHKVLPALAFQSHNGPVFEVR